MTPTRPLSAETLALIERLAPPEIIYCHEIAVSEATLERLLRSHVGRLVRVTIRPEDITDRARRQAADRRVRLDIYPRARR